MSTNGAIIIRPYRPSDSIEELTALLHAAYAPLAEQGMKYLASHQAESVTSNRLRAGESYVAVSCNDDRIVGTITFVPPDRTDADCEYYNKPGVSWFQQFAVDPAMQGQGVGSLLMAQVESRATAFQAIEIALDTSEHAHDLIERYKKSGYEIVGAENWDCTNYRSVLMRKVLKQS